MIATAGAYARWELSWPEQRHPAARPGGRVEPVQVIAVFGRGTTHPHLRGAVAGMWPCQVTDAADAERQEPILRAIVECELHERIFQAPGKWSRHSPAKTPTEPTDGAPDRSARPRRRIPDQCGTRSSWLTDTRPLHLRRRHSIADRSRAANGRSRADRPFGAAGDFSG
jgi:hypothetical protein